MTLRDNTSRYMYFVVGESYDKITILRGLQIAATVSELSEILMRVSMTLWKYYNKGKCSIFYHKINVGKKNYLKFRNWPFLKKKKRKENEY